MYHERGYADDAMVLTQELYDALLTEYEGQEESEYHTDLEYDAVSPAMTGTKWLVVVDYHIRQRAGGFCPPSGFFYCSPP